MALKTVHIAQDLSRTPLSADLSRASSVLDYVVPILHSSNPSKPTSKPSKPSSLEDSNIRVFEPPRFETSFFRARMMLPQVATGRQAPDPEIHEIS